MNYKTLLVALMIIGAAPLAQAYHRYHGNIPHATYHGLTVFKSEPDKHLYTTAEEYPYIYRMQKDIDENRERYFAHPWWDETEEECSSCGFGCNTCDVCPTCVAACPTC